MKQNMEGDDDPDNIIAKVYSISREEWAKRQNA